MHKELDKIAVVVHRRLQKSQLKGRTITLKVKFSDFTQVTRNHSFTHGVDDLDKIADTAKELLNKVDKESKPVRLLGISLANFGEPEPKLKRSGDPDQLDLFE